MILLLIASLTSAHAAAPICRPGAFLNVDKPLIEACSADAQAQGRDYLVKWIEERVRICQLNGQYLPDTTAPCLKEAISASAEVLACKDSPRRYTEAVDLDHTQRIARAEGFPKAEVPPHVKKLFLQLAKAADAHFGSKFSAPDWEIWAYEHDIPNATAGAGGKILISTAFWAGKNPWPESELAAILAHEISHVKREHSVELGCLALEWIGGENTLRDASETFSEDLANGFPRKEAWKKLSHRIEYDADRDAITVLEKAGLYPGAMASALGRLVTKSPGMPSGSHPEMEDRVKRAQETARGK